MNIELVDPNMPPWNPLSYFQYESKHPGSRREGMGSAEATEMVLNNLFYITAKVSYFFLLMLCCFRIYLT